MEKLGNFLTWADYTVILGSLVICMCVGIFHNRRPKRKAGPDSTEAPGSNSADYFLGGRQMSIGPIAISMLATSMSAVPIVSGTGEMYRFGMEYMFATLGIQCGKVLAGYMIVPVFKYLEYVSIYKYLENRFDRCVRLSFSLVYIFMNIMVAAVALYLPSLLLSTVTGFPYWITAFVSGAICTVYCTMGGFKTVVWTDVIQFAFMMISIFVIIIQGTIMAGGPAIVWKEGVVDGFSSHVSWLDRSDKRFTVISSLIFGVFNALQHFSTSQAVVQRILSVNSIKAAQRALVITAFLGVFFAISVVVASAVIYAYFHNCDPLMISEETGVKNLDLMFMYAVQIFLSQYPGLSGVVFAGVFSSSLSTISSYLNSFAAITLEDFIKPYYLNRNNNNNSESREIFISKCLTAMFGVVIIFLSFIVPFLGGAMEAFISVTGAIGGPLTGLMFLAMFVPRATKKSCIIGLVVGITFCVWLTIASPMYRSKPETLPLSLTECPGNRTFIGNNTYNEEPNGVFYLTEMELEEKQIHTIAKKDDTGGNAFFLYKLSFVWYGPIGMFLTFCVGVIASYIMKQKDHFVDPLLLSPFVKKRIQQVAVPLQAQKLNSTSFIYENKSAVFGNGNVEERL